MPLEDMEGPNKFLDAFNVNWPLGSDSPTEGDDHDRGTKNCVVNTFGPLDGYYPVDRAAFFVDNDNGQVDQGALEMAVGTTAQRPSDGLLSQGDTRWNVTSNRLETWDGTAWIELHAMAALTSMFRAKQNFEADLAKLLFVSSDESVDYADVLGSILDATAGSEEGALIVQAITAGALAEGLRVIGAGASSKRWHKRDGSEDLPLEDWETISEETTAAGQADVVMAWDNAKDYNLVRLELDGVYPVAGSVTAELAVSSNGGSSWLGAANYWIATYGMATSNVAVAVGGQGLTSIPLSASGNPVSPDAESSDYVFELQRPADAVRSRTIKANYSYYVTGLVRLFLNGSCGYGGAAAVDAVRFRFQGQNLQAGGRVRVLGRR